MQVIKCVLVGGTGKSSAPVAVAALLRSWGLSALRQPEHRHG